MSLRFVVVLTLIALLCLPAVGALAGADTEATLRITISPIGGDPGTNITVTGQGAKPDRPVKVMLATDGNTGAGSIAQVDFSPAADGTFAVAITVPEGTADGSYAVRAEQRNQNGGLIHYWWVSFQVGGGDALLPVTGTLPGTSIPVTVALAALLVVVLAVQGTRRALRR